MSQPGSEKREAETGAKRSFEYPGYVFCRLDSVLANMSEDTLTALRSAIKSKSKIKLLKDGEDEQNFLAATHIQLSSSVVLQKSAPSRLRKPGTSSDNPQSKPDDFIPIGAVYLAWLFKAASAADYMKHLRENGVSVAFVPITDRKPVVEWLEGKRSELPNAAPLAGDSHMISEFNCLTC